MPEPIDDLLKNLQERAKELSVIYHVEEILSQSDTSMDHIFTEIIKVLPSGWRYSDKCQIQISYKDKVFQTPGFEETPRMQSADIMVEYKPVGKILVSYAGHFPDTGAALFLKEEERLIKRVADRIGQTIYYKRLKKVFNNLETVKNELNESHSGKLVIILDTLRRSDRKLFIYISRRMLHHLCWVGIEEAKKVLEEFST